MYICIYIYIYVYMYIYIYLCICVYVYIWYQVPGTWYRVISRLISDHLDHFMRQIEGNCDPNLIRGVPGPKNRKIKNHALNQIGIQSGPFAIMPVCQ